MSRKIKSKVEWMNPIIETYKEDGDCRLATFIGLIRYYGVDVSINEMFGLGCGLDFSSINISVGSIKILGITGRNFEVEKSFCHRVNLKCREKISTYTPKKVFSKPFDIKILKVVSKGVPVIVNTDIYYMDYLKEKNLPHNRYHCVVIVGYNLKTKNFQVIDAMTNKMESLKMSSLLKGMHQQGQYFLEEGAWYYIEEAEEKIVSFPLSAYTDAIINQSEYMLSEDGPIQHIREVKEFIERVYGKALQTEENKYLAFLQVQVSTICSLVRTEDEVSGTFYRRLYLRFIEEFVNKFNIENKNIKKVLELLNQDALEWRKIAFKVRYNKEILVQTRMLLQALETIYNLEKEIFEILLLEEKNINRQRRK